MRYYRTPEDLAHRAIKELLPWPVRAFLALLLGILVVSLAAAALAILVAFLGFFWLAFTGG